MQNRVTELFNIDYPIVQAGMIWASGWRLASAVSNAGALGLIGSGSMNPGEKLALEAHLKALRLPTIKREYAKTALDAAREGASHERYLFKLVEMELADRDARAFAKHLKIA